jgi:hypothetical protein
MFVTFDLPVGGRRYYNLIVVDSGHVPLAKISNHAITPPDSTIFGL